MLPVVVANGEVPPEYLEPGLRLLLEGGSPLDAVEEIARRVEADPGYRTVGVGGLPNVAGQVELDALIMDGETKNVGAVAAVHGFPHPISIARAVTTDLPHVLLVGEGAERFARERGFSPQELLTEGSRKRWLEKLRELGVPHLEKADENEPLAEAARRAMRSHLLGDTMNAIACDSQGRMAVAVSTSGLAWKYPGRVGDTPIAGAGGYADSRYGAAAATGIGELVVRSGSSLKAVLYHASGLTPREVGKRVITELYELPGSEGARVRLIFVTPSGEINAFATWPGAKVVFQRAGAPGPETAKAEYIARP